MNSLSNGRTEEQDGIGSNAYALGSAEVLEVLGSDGKEGLSSGEAEKRLEQRGPNRIRLQEGTPWWRMLLAQFASIVVWLLTFAAAVAWLTGNPLEAAAIVVVLALNALIGFVIEFQAGRALSALRERSRATARVVRDGGERILDAEDLVQGDIVILGAGDRIPADARLIEAYNVSVDESTLTGESLPVSKSSAPVAEDTGLADRTPMLFLGSTVRTGTCRAVVTATGAATELGRIGTLLSTVSDQRTPLEIRLSRLGERLVYIVLAIAAIVLAAGYLRGDGIWMMLEVSISLAVAAVPEGLPAVTTLILALGVLKMARRNAIVRRLAAVETLGSTTVICTDKTGTLTENRIRVREYHAADGSVFEPDGAAALQDNRRRLIDCGVLCNDASPESGDGRSALGDPTETALLIAAEESGRGYAAVRSGKELVLEIPFDPGSKRMTSVWRSEDGSLTAALKGAPAVVLKACGSYLEGSGKALPLDDDSRSGFLATNRGLAEKAFRVLAFAEKSPDQTTEEALDGGYVFLGFAAMSDPLREEARPSVEAAARAGIRVVMLTGDQINTASAIAEELGLADDRDSAVHASEIVSDDPGELAKMVSENSVFARVSPEDKYNIVKALQGLGEVVAVTGDGVNDAPALKRADIGVAMGSRGTEVAKEASDIVLTDDNFATIVKAIEGGRTIYANIVRFVHMMFSHNLGEVLLIFLAIIAGLPLPLLPLQILWVNLVTDVFPALALAVEPPSGNTMSRPPRPAHSRMLSRELLVLIAWQGTLLSLISLGAYVWALSVHGEGAHARTVALLSLIGVQLGHFFNCRSRIRSAFDRPFSNPWIFAAAAVVVGLQVLAVYWSPLASVLGLERPHLGDAIAIAASVILPVIVVEIWKAVVRYRLRQRDSGKRD